MLLAREKTWPTHGAFHKTMQKTAEARLLIEVLVLSSSAREIQSFVNGIQVVHDIHQEIKKCILCMRMTQLLWLLLVPRYPFHGFGFPFTSILNFEWRAAVGASGSP